MSFYCIIRGPLGCGKTAISERLSKILNAAYFSVDMVLEEHGLDNDREAGYISQKSFKKANEILAHEAQKVLDSWKPVVFDGNFYWKSQIEDLISRLDFPHYVFTVKASLEICIERDKNRDTAHGEDATRAVFRKSTEFEYGSVVDASNDLKHCVDEILSQLPKP